MKIRTKLALTFSLLLLIAINGVSSYSIVFIHDFLLKQGVEHLRRDARWMALTISHIDRKDDITRSLASLRNITKYNLFLYDSTGTEINQYPEGKMRKGTYLPDSLRQWLTAHADSTYLIDHGNHADIEVFSVLKNSENKSRFIRLGLQEDNLIRPITTIRWIIYTGIFISVGLAIIVSILFARSISKPILQLTRTAHDIAKGDVDSEIHLKRKDEFGTLSDSLNQMASKLRADTEHLKRIYEQQRQFYADITHEVRNPLHTIVGSLDMLELENLEEEKRGKYILNIRNQVDRINRLFRDLMTLQRYDSDPQFIQIEPFDMSKLTQKIEDWYRETAAGSGIKLEVSKEPVTVAGDADKIEQVFDNLVSNAVKYSHAEKITVRYRKKGDRLEIEVSDNGTGIPENHLSKLFDRFYRTDKARSRDKGGTGLGLAVVKSILNAHHSDIEVESEVGKGTRFHFSLPLG